MKHIQIKKAGTIALFVLLLTTSLSTIAAADWAEVSFGGTVTIEGAGNSPPVNSNPSPSDGAVDISVNINSYAIDVSDPDGDTMHTYLYSNNTVDGSWFNWKDTGGLTNGTAQWVGSHDGYGNFLGMGSGDLDYSTTYYWSANTTDGNGNWDNDTYSFTTAAPGTISITAETPSNTSTYIDPTTGQVSASISCDQTFNWTIELYATSVSDDKGQTGANNENNGTKTFDFAGSLQPGQNYTYWVNATSSAGVTANESFWFTVNNTYTADIEVTANVTVVDDTEAAAGVLVNYTWWINNTGTGPLVAAGDDELSIDLTYFNCSCSDWDMTLIDHGTNITDANLTYFNDTCGIDITIANISGGSSRQYWASIQIQECDADTSGTARFYVNTSNQNFGDDSGYHDIAWSKLTSELRVSYTSRGAQLQPVAVAAITLTMIVSIVIAAAVILRKVNNLNEQ